MNTIHQQKREAGLRKHLQPAQLFSTIERHKMRPLNSYILEAETYQTKKKRKQKAEKNFAWKTCNIISIKILSILHDPEVSLQIMFPMKLLEIRPLSRYKIDRRVLSRTKDTKKI